jgi:hypothetical protein
VTFLEALQAVCMGPILRIRLPTWNDETWIALENGRPTVFRGNSPAHDCWPGICEQSSTDWGLFYGEPKRWSGILR